ncbi:ATP-binding cassette domain-containing protein [Solihabitans fulvus]|uniref:ATP-binding cassette domain-containing protein n=1 Tax=Solihabitans fulvus TaxID=1892852 RepID=A0A5B2WKD5_9PSEU|nr:ATP-binding cassette domain-containing protein [Solihabitans fulvus]KAA2251220.1 ATP-binding cassette domain-containing protein [Solihabitans fulvus]
MAEEPVFSVRGLVHRYRTPSGDVTALHGINLDVPADGLTVLAGPSGSGKSTLLRLLGLAERPTQGRMLLRGKDTTKLDTRGRRALRKRVHLLFQNPVDNLFDYLSVRENLRAAAQLAGRPDPGVELLDRLGLPGTADWAVSALSGGQQQRLALLTALAAGADVVLADEPTSQLDARSGELVVATLGDLVGLGVTVVVASHDDAVLAGATRVIRILDGRLVGETR